MRHSIHFQRAAEGDGLSGNAGGKPIFRSLVDHDEEAFVITDGAELFEGAIEAFQAEALVKFFVEGANGIYGDAHFTGTGYGLMGKRTNSGQTEWPTGNKLNDIARRIAEVHGIGFPIAEVDYIFSLKRNDLGPLFQPGQSIHLLTGRNIKRKVVGGYIRFFAKA